LATIVRSFKSASTKAANDLQGTRGARLWQRGYYERVLRGDRELNVVREYIRQNPLKWAEDENNPARQIFQGKSM
jgi:putative transposase